MGKQLEKGTQYPMRPETAILNLASGFTLISDTGTPDWTAAGSRVPIEVEAKYMADTNNHITDGGAFLDMRPGIYLVEFDFLVANGSGTVEDIRFAITNGDGTTVHVESSAAVTIPATPAKMQLRQTAVVHITAEGQDICLRAVQNTAGTDLTIQPERVGYIQKIGNVNEA